jgi:hypothetical protein
LAKKIVIVNHRSSPLDIRGLNARKTIHLISSAKGSVAAHSAVYLGV